MLLIIQKKKKSNQKKPPTKKSTNRWVFVRQQAGTSFIKHLSLTKLLLSIKHLSSTKKTGKNRKKSNQRKKKLEKKGTNRWVFVRQQAGADPPAGFLAGCVGGTVQHPYHDVGELHLLRRPCGFYKIIYI